MLNLSYDLHIHTCLSPCGDNDMTPANIVGMAYIKGLDVIAITDHNSCKNCKPALEVGKEYGVTVICGMELTTEEEVHVVCLFPSLEKAMEFDSYVYSKLLKIKNDPIVFGEQRICDVDDNIIATEPNLLINATSIPFDEVFPLVESFDGFAFPAHIEKSANSLIANLGFISPDSKFECVELKNMSKFYELLKAHTYLEKCKPITNSDAHYLQDINEAVNYLHCESRDVKDILNALKSKFNK